MNMSSFPYIEVLRGRDGRDGRDGVPGTRGAQGQRGDQGMVGWSTQGGGKVLVQESQVPHWCMQGGLGGLVEHFMDITEEQSTTSAC